MRNHIEKRFSLDDFTCLKGLLSEMSPTFISVLMFARHSPVQSAVKERTYSGTEFTEGILLLEYNYMKQLLDS